MVIVMILRAEGLDLENSVIGFEIGLLVFLIFSIPDIFFGKIVYGFQDCCQHNFAYVKYTMSTLDKTRKIMNYV